MRKHRALDVSPINNAKQCLMIVFLSNIINRCIRIVFPQNIVLNIHCNFTLMVLEAISFKKGGKSTVHH